VRNRNIVVICVIAAASVVAGILFFGRSDVGDGDAINRGPGRGQATAAIALGGPFFNQLFESAAPDASQAVTSATASARSSAGAGARAGSSVSGGAPSVARFAAPPRPARVCTPSLVGAVLGLLGSVLGGGSGC